MIQVADFVHILTAVSAATDLTQRGGTGDAKSHRWQGPVMAPLGGLRSRHAGPQWSLPGPGPRGCQPGELILSGVLLDQALALLQLVERASHLGGSALPLLRWVQKHLAAIRRSAPSLYFLTVRQSPAPGGRSRRSAGLIRRC